tara:strand:- start:7481 stop:7804 length:324 start_codon:yes stop_codon:yes gene_type:complete
MPHQNVEAGKATAQNAATDPRQPNDQARGEHASVRPEPRSYVAPDVKDASLAAPAAGEVAEYMDEGDDLGGDAVQQGRDRTNIAAHSRDPGHGPKTQKAIDRQMKPD